MIYYKEYTLSDQRTLVVRNGEKEDGEAVLWNFVETHGESDFLLTYPEECTFTPEKEGMYMEREKKEEREAQLVALLEGKIVGSAGVESIGNKMKIKHRCSFGVSVSKAYWGMGIGKALTLSSIECAKNAGYSQMELEVVKDNYKAISLYEKLGFVKYGENEKGFLNREGKYQSLVLMKLDLE